MSRFKPSIIISYYEPDEYILQQIKAGIEEEGCLFSIDIARTNIDSLTLSYRAARQSVMGIGIGINKKQIKLAVKQQLEPIIIQLDEANARTIGQNAARFMKKKPLR